MTGDGLAGAVIFGLSLWGEDTFRMTGDVMFAVSLWGGDTFAMTGDGLAGDVVPSVDEMILM